MGSEQDDLLRIELLRHPARKAADLPHRNVRPPVDPIRGIGLFLRHSAIVPGRVGCRTKLTCGMTLGFAGRDSAPIRVVLESADSGPIRVVLESAPFIAP